MSAIPTSHAIATVISVSGLAFARNAEGAVRSLAAGDIIYEGEIVFTMAEGQVELAFSDGHHATILPSESYLMGPEAMIATSPDAYEAAIAAAGEVGKVIAAAEGQGDILDDLQAPAAGPGEDSGNSFVRLLRISEGVTPIGFEFPVNSVGNIQAPEGTVIPGVEPPTPTIDLTGVLQEEINIEPLWLKEDTGGLIKIEADTNIDTHLTQIVITGLDSSWNYDFGGLSGTVVYSPGTGTLTISNLSGTNYLGYFSATPPEDSDADLGTLTATVTAAADIDPSVTATASDTTEVYVDAVLDYAVNATQSPVVVDESSSGDNVIGLNLSTGLVNAGFTYSGTGGADGDNSEKVTAITIHVDEGSLSLVGYGGSASLINDGDGNYHLTNWANDADASAAIAALNVTVPEGWDGLVSGSISITTQEANTPEGSVPASGQEDDVIDNTKTLTSEFSVTVNPVAEAPTTTLSGSLYEDTQGTLSFSATPSGDDAITQIVISNVPTGWTVDDTSVALTGTYNNFTANYVGTTLTINVVGADGAISGTVAVTPSTADTAEDLYQDATLHIVATATDGSDSTASTPVAANIVVDAVLDDAVAFAGDTGLGDNVGDGVVISQSENSAPQAFNVSSASVFSPFDQTDGAPVDSNESGTLTITVTGGLASGATLWVNGVQVSLNGSNQYILNGTAAELEAAIDSVQVKVDGYWDGHVEGTMSVTMTDPAIDSELVYPANNTYTSSTTFDITVDAVAEAPETTLSGSLYEDTQGTLSFSATPSGDDAITQIVISNVPTGWTVDDTSVALTGTYTSFTANYVGTTLTINVVGADGAISGTVNVTPSTADVAEDLDQDATLTIVATATDGSASTPSSPVNSTIVVDAVLDTFADVSATAQTSNEFSGVHIYSLGITLDYVAATDPPIAPAQTDGAPADSNETFTATITLDAPLTGEATLYVDPAYGTLVPTGTPNQWTISASSPANLELAVESLGISAPAGWDTGGLALTGTISVESNDPEGDFYLTLDNNTLTDAAGFSLTVSPNAPNILDGSLITNTNVQDQGVILTFVDQATPYDSYARLFPLDQQGQEGNVNTDTGFDIHTDEQYTVAVEHATGTKAIITDMELEGVTIVDKGNVQLDSVSEGKPFAFTAVITPESGLDQPVTDSTDGDVKVGGSIDTTNTLNDPSPTAVNYLWGGSDTDTLNGGSGIDFLNGGTGTDSLNGGDGDDVLVYDSADTNAGGNVDGGNGFDTLRIDQGALELFYNPGETEAVVDLTLADTTKIHNIESLLITDDSTSDPDKGTRLVLSAEDVFNMTDSDHVLYVNGNDGDTVDLTTDAGGTWNYTGYDSTGHFLVYEASYGGGTVQLLIEDGANTINVLTNP